MRVVATAEEALRGVEARALSHLEQGQARPIRGYLELMGNVRSADLRSPEAAHFRRKFNGYYGVRRGTLWRDAFYEMFEQAKISSAAAPALFADLVDRMADTTGRIEASFCSKLVATLDPSAPVLDSIVSAFLGRFGMPTRGPDVPGAVAYYEQLCVVLGELSHGRVSRKWTTTFDTMFGQLPGATEIHSMKKLDFLIWSGAR
jgi:hypothetical protein